MEQVECEGCGCSCPCVCDCPTCGCWPTHCVNCGQRVRANAPHKIGDCGVSMECKHGMNPEWCANCKGLKTPEEEEQQYDSALDSMIENWNK